MILDQNDQFTIETFPIGTLGCNCTLIYGKNDQGINEAIIIDPGNDNSTLLKILQNRKIEKVDKLLHTHAHFDHIGGSWNLKQVLNASLYLHPGDLFLYENLPEQGMFFGESLERPGPLDFQLNDEEEFHHCSCSLKTIHTPGHTPGSVSFHLFNLANTPLLLSGDTLFQQSIGRTDLPGGDSQLIVKSIKNRLYHLPEETKIVPGHGPLTSIYHEKKNNPFVRL